ncbi:MAG TPA: type II CAAX endopeptidase family protein [Terriglobales bacterium]|nr:type II CAAX endopeptidase family protein [Terriglobales bacterium]
MTNDIALAAPTPDPALPQPPLSMTEPVAPYWHTALIILIMAAVATISAFGHKDRIAAAGGPMSSYISTMLWQWALFGLVVFGIRRKGLTIRDLLGKRWRGFDDVLMDVVYAAGFFIVSKLILAVVVVGILKLFHLPEDTFTLKKSMDAVSSLTPRTLAEMGVWIALSITAGFVEEIVFRGYLQRQFGALARNATLGIILSALVFGSAHAYQGFLQVTIITALGGMFGVLAHWRQSLKPGIIAHAGQDIFSGLALSFLSRNLRP